ncbi:MAG: MFS transporter [Chloroflexi bacterium]|nr:MFS transporter [Chloroflexota bacterium]
MLRHVVIDIGPLRRRREFRLLWIGQAVSFFGSMVTQVAIPYQTYQLTHSSLAVGLLSAVQLVPLVSMLLFGGLLADTVDRRRLVLMAETALLSTSLALLVNARLAHPQLWLLFVVGALMSAFSGIQGPPLDALLPRVVERDELPAAVALSMLRGTVGSIAGPALGGVLIGAAGLGAAYAFDAATFAVSLAALGLMRAVPPPDTASPPGLGAMAEGFRFAWSRPEILGTYGVDIVAMFFGMPMALFPALAQQFGGGTALGLLYAAPSMGSLLASATSGWVSRVDRHGAAVCLAAAGWGAGIVCLAFAPTLALAVVSLAFAGFCDMLSGLFRGVIWNRAIPDRLRGRLAAINQISYSTGPLLGNVESGFASALIGLRGAIWSGGLLCIVGVAGAMLLLPEFWRYNSARRPEGVSESA